MSGVESSELDNDYWSQGVVQTHCLFSFQPQPSRNDQHCHGSDKAKAVVAGLWAPRLRLSSGEGVGNEER